MLGLDTCGSDANTCESDAIIRESKANSGTIELSVFKHDKSAL